MLRGIESTKQGMLSALHLNDTIANNMANISTTGFKQSKVVFKNIQDTAIENLDKNKHSEDGKKTVGSISLGSGVDSVIIDFQQGAIKSTGNPLDLAINGDGFFRIKKENGDVAYTRNGNFLLAADGTLKTVSGESVLGKEGPIKIDIKRNQASEIIISEDGSIELEQEKIGQVDLVDFKDKTSLKSVGSSMYVPINPDEKPVKAENCQVTQGAIESSNANVIGTMVNSITAMRTYETLNNIMQTTSKTLEKNVNNVGRITR